MNLEGKLLGNRYEMIEKVGNGGMSTVYKATDKVLKRNVAVKILGAVKTSIYIYIVPIVTVVTSLIILNEQITLMSFIGTILTLIGLFLSQDFRDKG